jgi:hypothetical protein
MKAIIKELACGILWGGIIMYLLTSCSYTTYEHEIHKPIHNIHPIEQTDPFEEAYA